MISEIQDRPAIRTARLHMRPLRLADAPRIAALANDFDVVKMTGGMPFPYGLNDAQSYLARMITSDLSVDAPFAIDLVGEGLIGTLGFHGRGALGPEVGYWFGKAYWGQGLATEMLRGAMIWARDVWEQRCVVASHFIDNGASGVVLCKSGFLYTGQVDPRPCKARGEPVEARWMVWLA